VSAVVASYLVRLKTVLSARTYDLVWAEKELLPYIPGWLENLALSTRIPLVLDYDDAIFHSYDSSAKALVRMTLGSKVQKLVKRAQLVICGNRYLADYAQAAGAMRVEVVPTVVDASRYVPAVQGGHGIPVIGWIGSPMTQHYLDLLGDVFKDLALTESFHLKMVGASDDFPEQLGISQCSVAPWSEESEADLIAAMDIGIMPLGNSGWDEGKCGYKLIQYMASGLPFVASSVGANRDILAKSGGGFIAATDMEWKESLVRLLTDAPLRKELGGAGRAAVESHYSLEAQRSRLYDLLLSVSRAT
jgi:glycosyltransferase involved in cell wall biosynthesis